MKIIDGYNLIGAAGAFGMSLSQADKEERLLRFLAAFRTARGGGSVLVVFDGDYDRLVGGRRTSRRGGLRVEWSCGESADALIVRKVRRSRNPRGIEVVTSDEELLGSVRAAGAAGVRCRDFLRQAARSAAASGEAEKPDRSTPEEMKEWLAIFGDDD